MNIQNRISLRLSVVARMQRTRFDMRARSIGVTLAQWRVLHALSSEEGVPQRRVAEMIDVGDVTAGRLIDRLVEKGWIERRPDPCDRRAHHIFLTGCAMPILDQLTELGADEMAQALTGVSEADMAVVADVLCRMAANLEKATPATVGVVVEEVCGEA